jgi:hypothetical protein
VFTDFRSYYLLRSHCSQLTVDDGTSTRWGLLTNTQYVVFNRHMTVLRDGYYFPHYWLGDTRSDYLKNNFEEIYNNLPSRRPVLWGIPLGKEPVGYGVVIYRRKGIF